MVDAAAAPGRPCLSARCDAIWLAENWATLRSVVDKRKPTNARLRHHAILGGIGETVDAMLCDPSVAGFPDRRTDVPVQVRLVSEQTLCVHDEPRAIIWSVDSIAKTCKPQAFGA